MTIGTFNYPGGKTTIADWIIQYIPEHEVYVEPFGGSAGVMANKAESPLEVYNDTASLCVDFFRAVKRKPDELQNWVQTTPYSRELFDEYTQKLVRGEADGLVERAGMFWFVQFASIGGLGLMECDTPRMSINASAPPNRTRADDSKSASENISKICERFRSVQIENLDFETVFDKYDSKETVFYCDPPYVDVGDDYYQTGEGGFNHERFVNSLHDLKGKWLVSYNHNIPEGLCDYTIIERTKHTNMSDSKEEKTETLIMNYDPNDTPMFREQEQQGLEAYE